jgi:hypothetical protein
MVFKVYKRLNETALPSLCLHVWFGRKQLEQILSVFMMLQNLNDNARIMGRDWLDILDKRRRDYANKSRAV